MASLHSPLTKQSLQSYANFLASLRQFFAEEDFTEVTTPLLLPETIIDRNLEVASTLCNGETLFFQTSPELAMKKLLAEFPEKSLYQITKSVRPGEIGPLHKLEFTLLEWYGVGDDYTAGMARTDRLLRHLLPELGERETLTYREAFERFLSVNPFTATDEELSAIAQRECGELPADLDRLACLDLLLTQKVQPHLGQGRPTFLIDWLPEQAALAKVENGVARRFELFLQGVELANGYDELLDAEELLRRQETENAGRAEKLPLPKSLIEAHRAGLPAMVGVAVGLDRLFLLASASGS